MDINKLVTRVRRLLSAPKSEWPIISAEPTTVPELYKGYIAIIAAVPAVITFLKMSVIGIGVPFMGTMRIGIGSGLAQMVLSYLLSLAVVYVMALIIDALAPTFGAQKNRVQALKTAAYAYTAVWIAYVGQLLPWLGLLIVIAGVIYSIYLLYIGLPHTMHSPPEKTAGYTAATIAVGIALGIVVSIVLGGVGMMGAGSMSAGGYAANTSSDIEFEKDSPGGKLQQWAQNMEAASNKMEQAAKSGDGNAQGAALQQLVGTAMSGGDAHVASLPPEQLQPFLPETIGDWRRSSFNVQRNAALGIQMSEATARYEADGGRAIDVEITDMGSAKGLAQLAGWMGMESEAQSSSGYEKSYRDGDRLVHEKWDHSGAGEYAVVIAERFAVTAKGQAREIDELKEFVHSLELGELEDLRLAGVEE